MTIVIFVALVALIIVIGESIKKCNPKWGRIYWQIILILAISSATYQLAFRDLQWWVAILQCFLLFSFGRYSVREFKWL